MKIDDQGGQVKGTWNVFIPNDIKSGTFKIIQIKHRIKAENIYSFICIHNTNLHNISLDNARGYMIMCDFNNEGAWHLCFVYKLSTIGSVLFKWRGCVNGNGVPLFFYSTLREYIENFESNFSPEIVPGLPVQSFFVNIIFNRTLQVPNYMYMNDTLHKYNVIDGCVDQSVVGPDKMFIPALKWAETTFAPFYYDMTIGWKELFKTKIRPSWTDRDKNFEGNTKTTYDAVFVPSFKYKEKPFKCMAFASPKIHPHAHKYDLPKQWTMRTVFEYNYEDKLPQFVKLSSLYEESSKFAISMDVRLAYEGTNLRVFLIDTLKEWKLLLKNQIGINQRIIKYGKGYEAIIAETNKDPITLPGIYVSGWTEFSQSVKLQVGKDVGYTFSQDVYKVINNGFGSRRCSKCVGINQYFGPRSNSRACQTPVVGPKQTDKQQYYRTTWSKHACESLRVYLESTVRKLPVEENMALLAYNYSKFIGFDTCDKLIYTSGKPNGVFSFGNETHDDAKDFVDEDNKIGYIKELDTLDSGSDAVNEIKKYIKKMINHRNKLPMPTTCAYLHCWEDQESCRVEVEEIPYHYFDYPQFGIMKRIGHEQTHWMLPGLFYHRTNLCIILRKGIIFFRQHSKIRKFTIIAWGRSGGTAESKRNASNRHRQN